MKRHAITMTLAALLMMLCQQSTLAAGALRAGVAGVDITPPVGCWLAGWAIRDKPSEGIEDPLFAKAMVLESGGTTAAILTADLIHIGADLVAEIRSIIERETGIPGGNVMVSASHTHFSPVVDSREKAGERADEAYLDVLVRKMASTVVMAGSNLRPVRAGWARGEAGELMFNRRTRRPDGKVVMTFVLPPADDNLEFGPIDPAVGVLRVEDESGRLLGSLINFGCHPVTGGGHGTGWESWFYNISAEYPGIATGVVESAEGGLCLFTLGEAGDLVPVERGVSPRFEIGRALGGEALRRLQFMETADDLTLAVAGRTIELPVRKKIAADSYVERPERPVVSAELQAMRIGDTYLVAIPGEVLVEVGLMLKRKAVGRNLLVVSLANGSIGYICHREAYEEGGYESMQATFLAPGAAEMLVDEALALIGELDRR